MPKARKPDEPVQPICPHCGFKPCQVGMTVLTFGTEDMIIRPRAVVYMCNACETILSVCPIMAVDTTATQAQRAHSIIIPQ